MSDPAGVRACPYCRGALAALHHTGQRRVVHLYCVECGAHGYGRDAPVRWMGKKDWAAWIEGDVETEQEQAA